MKYGIILFTKGEYPLSSYNFNLTLENIRTITVMFLDIFIMWLVLYYAIKIVRNNSRTIQIFKGILLIIIIDAIAKFLGLKTLAYLTDMFINWGFLAIIIIFQPEIRSLLERMGKSNVFSRITTLSGDEKEKLVDQIVTATMLLSKDQTGALICIEQSHPLDDFIATGTRLNSDVTAELLTSIFVTSTPLHDGAVIIQGDKIACASAYFPPTNLDLPSRYGARHRAAIGISEITDAVTIVVSEETGGISITEGGKIFTVNRKQLRDYLLRVICGEVTEVRAAVEPTRPVIIDDAKAKVKKEAEALKRQDTSVLSKLAIKKQDTQEIKIKAEAVKPAGDTKEEPVEEIHNQLEDDMNTAEQNEPYQNLDAEEMEDRKMEELEREENSIKLPHKKDRPVPSYPKQEVHPDYASVKPAETPLAAADAKKKQEEIVRAQMEASDAMEKIRRARQEAETHEQAQAETPVEPVHVMSPEEVRAAREAMKAKLSSKPVQKPAEDTGNLVLDQELLKKESREFDTSKIDISKIMGYEDELDKTFEMVDQLSDVDGKKKNPSGTKGGNK